MVNVLQIQNYNFCLKIRFKFESYNSAGFDIYGKVHKVQNQFE